MLQHCPPCDEVSWLCADQSLPGLQQMREDPKWRAAMAEQQDRFFAMDTAAGLSSHIVYIKENQILSVEALADIVWCYPALRVRLVPKPA